MRGNAVGSVDRGQFVAVRHLGHAATRRSFGNPAPRPSASRMIRDGTAARNVHQQHVDCPEMATSASAVPGQQPDLAVLRFLAWLVDRLCWRNDVAERHDYRGDQSNIPILESQGERCPIGSGSGGEFESVSLEVGVRQARV